ncbi:MAG TPA: hypothetical protein VFG42_05175 [Baekduia sp.]|uniref:hypothetical protein n=1 Tax=Baekduia sp. TaxID=2600305 RepID=UPI002D7987C0|nr:hypothetical protein [Baekduia sp.]HET6506158.1 hypothetical protein [Baekduia sp.]
MLAIRGAAPGLLDEPLLLEVGGAPPGAPLTWRARIRDDDGFVWRASGATPDALAWAAAKPASAGAIAALRSLRPVELDVRVEDEDGGGASRTLTRSLLADGVKARRWRDGGVAGTLYLPGEATGAGVILDARAPSEPRDDSVPAADVAPPAAALLASRGVLAFVLARGDADAVREQLARVPSAPPEIAVLDGVPVPAGVPAQAPADPVAWDALLRRLGARPRRVAR